VSSLVSGYNDRFLSSRWACEAIISLKIACIRNMGVKLGFIWLHWMGRVRTVGQAPHTAEKCAKAS
jgi:hypothetical protein